MSTRTLDSKSWAKWISPRPELYLARDGARTNPELRSQTPSLSSIPAEAARRWRNKLHKLIASSSAPRTQLVTPELPALSFELPISFKFMTSSPSLTSSNSSIASPIHTLAPYAADEDDVETPKTSRLPIVMSHRRRSSSVPRVFPQDPENRSWPQKPQGTRRWTFTITPNKTGTTLDASEHRRHEGYVPDIWWTGGQGSEQDDVCWNRAEELKIDTGVLVRTESLSSSESESTKLDTRSTLHTDRSVSLPPSPTVASRYRQAERVALICDELVRTERHYLRSLQTLLSGETTTAPPALMLRYAASLVAASEDLLRRMEEDVSAWGVASAFLGAEDALESAFVGWCGVVGAWFSDEPHEMKRRRVWTRSVTMPSMGSLRAPPSTPQLRMPAQSTLSSGFYGAGPGAGLGLGYTTVSIPPARPKEKQKAVGLSRRLSVRDLAILPTQRVMRYALLYRDLLSHLPSTTPSHALVQSAIEASCRIAQKCDRAQGNSAFLLLHR